VAVKDPRRLLAAAASIGAAAVLLAAVRPWLLPPAPARKLQIAVPAGAAAEVLPLARAAALGPLCPSGRRRGCVRLSLVSDGAAGGDRPLAAVDGLAALSAADPARPVAAVLAERPPFALVALRGHPAGVHFLWHDLVGERVALPDATAGLLVRALLQVHGIRAASVLLCRDPAAVLSAGRASYALVPWTEAVRLTRAGEARVALDLARESPPLPALVVTVDDGWLEGHRALAAALLDRLAAVEEELARGRRRIGLPSGVGERLRRDGVWPAEPTPDPAAFRRLAVLAHLAGLHLPPPEGLALVGHGALSRRDGS
jgi:hypothetical protein